MKITAQLRFLSNLLSVLNRKQRDHAFRLSVAETATQNIADRLDYMEGEYARVCSALAELYPLVKSAREYATPNQLWAISVAKEAAGD
jgi:flagellar biosynthesis chaperone FliJ